MKEVFFYFARFKQHKYLQYSLSILFMEIEGEHAGGICAILVVNGIVLFDAENCFAKKLNDSCCVCYTVRWCKFSAIHVHNTNNNEMEE